jgi:monoamine oxidase
MIARTLCRLDIAGLLAVAEERVAIETRAVERTRTLLDRYDAESERLLAETDGRVKSLRARLRFAEDGMSASGPSDPETVVALRAELQQADEDNNLLLVHRLEGRDAMTSQFSDAAARLIAAGADILELAAQAEQFVTLTADLPTVSAEAEPAGSAS